MTRIIRATLALMLTASAAHATNCGPKDAVAAMLHDKHGEAVTGGGFAPGTGTIFMVFANPVTGTWSIVEVNAAGLACLRASGVNWVSVEAVPVGSPT